MVSSCWTNSLSQLHDSCPYSPPEYVRKTVEFELKKSIGEIFVSFEMKPLASASIGQVHCASIKNSDFSFSNSSQQQTDPCFTTDSNSLSKDNSVVQVIVKVQHEDIHDIMTSDMKIVINIAQIAAKIDSRWEVSINYSCCVFFNKSIILFHN
jgi:predicted unusual protein kinase regulating ubiquinone biosynthesis (AarF/ABC1/UbiB family)